MARIIVFFLAFSFVVTATPINKAVSTVSNETFFADAQHCYPGLGCFTSHGPGGQFPMTPHEIGTTFYAYTAASSSVAHILDASKPATFSMVNAHKRLAILIHGFTSSHEDSHLQSIKTNMLHHSNGEVGTVIVVDWRHGASALALPPYLRAASNTQVVGHQVAHLVEELRKHHGVNPHNVYIVGHSLGAQSAGFAGRYALSTFHWKLGRITALDAAAPSFENHPGTFLTKNDAVFVDAIHTSASKDHNPLNGVFGFVHAFAHLDFYPNDGHNQPKCHNPLEIACHHEAALLYYDASLSAHNNCKFYGFSCHDWATFHAHHCTKHDAEMGYFADKIHASGVRFLATTEKYPFCH